MTSRTTFNALALVAAAASLALFTAGCPEEGIVCAEGLTACGGKTCEDLDNDPRNCGACGVACGAGQVCSEGACACAPGAQDCGGSCVVLASNPQNCGACGNVCAAGQLCEAGGCVTECAAGNTACGASCVNTQSDDNNCGACGTVCEQGKSCNAGACAYEVIAACFSSGQVRGMRADTFVAGPLKTLGSAPQALARFGNDTVLAIDGTDQRLYRASLSELTDLGGASQVGAVPNHLLVSEPYVFVTNAGDGTVSVLGADGGTFTAIDEVQFGANSFPEVMARVGDKLYVTLYGGMDSTTLSAGQKVVEVNISNPQSPVIERTFDLATLSLRTFVDGGTSIPRPMGITARGETLYVALNHLDDTWAPAGPAYVATVALDGGMLNAIELPEDKCLNAMWTAPVGEGVAVSCAGRTNWSDFTTSESGIALIGPNDQVTSAIELGCPADNDGGCPSVSLSRFGVVGNSILAGDQSGGRVFVLEVENGQLVEKRGYGAQAPLDVCPISNGFGNVSDLLAVP